MLADLLSQYCKLRERPFEDIEKDDYIAEYDNIRQAISTMPFKRSDITWLRSLLKNEVEKWFVVVVVGVKPELLESLFDDFIRAGVYETNPSANRAFIEPCVDLKGHRCVNERLFEYVKKGTDFEKAGAINALYWARGPALGFKGDAPEFTVEHAIPETVAAWEAFNDMRSLRQHLIIQEFVNNPDINVRRSIIPGLVLDEEIYPDHLKPLVAEAIDIARNHSDEYIRHRVEVQLGNEGLLKPLPHRDGTQSKPKWWKFWDRG